MAGVDADEVMFQSQMVRAGKMGGGYKKACILRTVSPIELKLSQNVPEGVSYAVQYFQGCQDHDDVTTGVNNDAASRKWENTVIFMLIITQNW